MKVTPGMRTSEFKVAVATAILSLANSSQNWVTWHQALPPIGAAVAYIISRGLAKTEVRPGG